MYRLLGLPAQASEHAARLDHVTVLVHGLMAVLFVLWTIFFLYILFRFRKKSHPKADHDGFQGHATSWVEGGVVIAEIVLLAAFSIPLYSERVDGRPPEDQAFKVRVVGEQFAWNVHYPGPDGRFGATKVELVDAESNPLGLDRTDAAAADDVTTLNQLHLPVDTPVIVYLSSKDVIHSFMLNEMRVKQDAIPGMVFPVWFEPTKTTAEMREETGNAAFGYEIACAQLCGLGHYRMKGFVTVHEQAELDAWMAGEQAKLQKSAEGGDDFWG